MMDTVSRRPLVVDMDGTLIRSDMLLETLLRALKANPLVFFMIPFWLLQGRSCLKARLAERGKPDVTVMPLVGQVVEFIREHKSGGGTVILATASDEHIANELADSTGLFDEVLASDGRNNLKASRKAEALVARFGEHGFDYVGNDRADIPIWRVCHTAHVVSAHRSFASASRSLGVQAGEWFELPSAWQSWPKALRLHQWVKNLLVFIPIIMAHQFGSFPVVFEGCMAFLAFSCCASSVYLLNDMLDLDDDRHHRSKCRRPMASGDMSILTGMLLFPLMLVMGLVIAWDWTSREFVAVLGTYYVLTIAYSFWLKRLLFIDVVLLAGLYTIRIIGGAVATSLEPSFWLVAFSVFIFLSLAIVKRYTELLLLSEKGEAGTIKGRGYSVQDLPILLSLGTASAYLSVLVMALYINSDDVKRLYSMPKLLWLLCPVMLYWVSRIWILTHRGLMHDDPIVFAIKDPVSRYVAILMALILWLALWLVL